MRNTFPLVLKITITLATSHGLGLDSALRAESCGFGPQEEFKTKLSLLVSENEPFARLWLWREDVNSTASIDYFTTGSPGRFPARPAEPDVHYIPTNGTVRFEVGQNVTGIDIPLRDNGLLDGPKDFTVVLTHAASGLTAEHLVRIEDNELHSTVDPLFAPEVIVNGPNPPIVMPDGRVLVSVWAMLLSDGSIDTDFAENVAVTMVRFNNAAIWPIQALADGRLLAVVVSSTTNEPRRLIRLLSNGALDSVLFAGRVETAGAQPSGKILLNTEVAEGEILFRLNEDGSPDPAFPQLPMAWFDLAPGGKFLSSLSNTLYRFQPDGSRDDTFTPRPLTGGFLLPQADGKILIRDENMVVRLHEDGSTDTFFHLDPMPFPHRSWSLIQNSGDAVLTSEIDSVDSGSWGFGVVTQTPPDGSPRRVAARFRQPSYNGSCAGAFFRHGISLAGADKFFITGQATNVDGFPRNGLARLFLNPPERDFRVITPARFRRNTNARITIVRTGPTTTAASVAYTTRDGSAIAGRDYEPRSGTLHFAPLEVSKEVTVRLIGQGRSADRLSFQIALDQPSSTYTAIASTPVHILPDLVVSLDSLDIARFGTNGGISGLKLRGTVPGKNYPVEYSTNLIDWVLRNTAVSISTNAIVDVPFPATPRTFFRAREE